jgi:hypothetical protein
VRVAVQARALSTASATQAVCADFTLLPFALDAAGNATGAGAALSLPRAGAASGTAAIAGCIDSLDSPAHDFRYLVSATGFVDCASGLPIAGLTQATATSLVDFDCQRGLDVPVDASVSVAVATPNAGGYLDVSVGVNVSTPQAGCKQADVDSAGLLHFGQSYLQTAGGPAPSAYTGVGVFTPPSQAGSAPGTLQQFQGSVKDPSGATDVYFTGLLALPPAPQTALLVQALAPACAADQMTLLPRAVECVTQAALQGEVTTQVNVADVFVSWPGHASASASVTGPQALTVTTSLGGPHLSTVGPAASGFDVLSRTQTLALAAPDRYLSVQGSLQHSDELVALVQTAAGVTVVLLTLDEATGLWSAGAGTPLASLSAAQVALLGLFSQASGCLPLPPPPNPPCDRVCFKPKQATVRYQDSDFATWTMHPFSDPAGGPTDATATRTLLGANPVLEVVDYLGPLGPGGVSSNVQGLLDYPAATWNTAAQGPITGLFFDLDLRILSRNLYAYDGSSFPGHLQQVDDQYGSGFNVEALLEQGGHHYVASFAFACAFPNDPACTEWHHVAGGFNNGGVGGNLPFTMLQEPFHTGATPALDLSPAGAPITFGLSLAVSGGAAGYVGGYDGQIDNFDLAICSCR